MRSKNKADQANNTNSCRHVSTALSHNSTGIESHTTSLCTKRRTDQGVNEDKHVVDTDAERQERHHRHLTHQTSRQTSAQTRTQEREETCDDSRGHKHEGTKGGQRRSRLATKTTARGEGGPKGGGGGSESRPRRFTAKKHCYREKRNGRRVGWTG